MATQVSSFSLSDGDGIFHAIMKLVTSNRSKWEIATIGHYFRKCEDDRCVPATRAAMDPPHALHEWHPMPH